MSDQQSQVEGQRPHSEPANDTATGVRPHVSQETGFLTPKRARFWAFWLMLGVAIMGGLVWWASDRESESGTAISAVGDSVVQQYQVSDRVRIGEFSGDLLDGGSIHSDALAGNVTVYNVWGSWCVPCRTEAPDLVRLAGEYGNEAKFIGINVREGEAAARAFEREFGVPYPSITTASNSSVILAMGSAAGAAVPTTIFVDGKGRIAARVVGPGTYTTFRTLLDGVLAEHVAANR